MLISTHTLLPQRASHRKEQNMPLLVNSLSWIMAMCFYVALIAWLIYQTLVQTNCQIYAIDSFAAFFFIPMLYLKLYSWQIYLVNPDQERQHDGVPQAILPKTLSNLCLTLVGVQTINPFSSDGGITGQLPNVHIFGSFSYYIPSCNNLVWCKNEIYFID